MKKILLVLILIAVTSLSASAADKMMASDLRSDMRKLWEDHIVYTRNFIISFAGNLPGQDAVSTRLLQNQVDIGDATAILW